MIKIPAPQGAFSSSKVALAGVSYDFTFRYNSYAKIWQLDIHLNKTPVILGESLVPLSPLFYGEEIKGFNHGGLVLVSNVETAEPCGLNNLGIDRDYTLIYITNEEWADV